MDMLNCNKVMLSIFVLITFSSCENLTYKTCNASHVSSIKHEYNQVEQHIKYSIKENYKDVNLYKDINSIYSIEGSKLYRLAMINVEKYIYKKDTIKIVVRLESQDRNLVSEYFYKNKQLFFVYKNMKNKNGKKDTEDRFYFENKQMIKWLHGDKNMQNITPKWLKEKQIILHDSLVYTGTRNIKI